MATFIMGTVFTDDFTGTNGAAWNSTHWTTYNTTGSTMSIQTNAGRMTSTNASASYYSMAMDKYAARQDFDVTVKVFLSTTTNNNVMIAARTVMPMDGTIGKPSVKMTSGVFVEVANNTNAARLRYRTGGTTTTIGTSGTNVGVSAWYSVRLQVIGTAAKMKIWLDSNAEPGTWDVEGTVPAMSSGNFAITRESLSTANSPIANFDDVVVDEPSSGTNVVYVAEPMFSTAAMPDAIGRGNVVTAVLAEDTTKPASASFTGGGLANAGIGTYLVTGETWYLKPATITLAAGEAISSAKLYLYPAANATSDSIEIRRITSAWTETGIVSPATEPTSVFVKNLTVDWNVSGYTEIDISDVLSEANYGVEIRGAAVSVASTENATVAQHPYTRQVIATQTDVTIAAPVATAAAAMPDATVSTTSSVSVGSQPMTATAEMGDAVGSGEQFIDVTVDAEPMDAYAAMGDSGFAVPVNVNAEVMTATAESLDAAVDTEKGVVFNAAPMAAETRWFAPELVNGAPIEVNEAEDRYFQRVNSFTPTRWFRLNDKGSTVKDRATGLSSGVYVGAQMGQFNAPDNRHSVHFDGNDYVNIDDGDSELTYNAPSALEFSFRTTKANTFLLIGQDKIREVLQDVAVPAIEARLKDGKITMRYWNFGRPSSITAEFTGFRNLNDGEWHHVVIRETDKSSGAGNNEQGSGVEIWVDGKFEIRRYGRSGFTGSPDYLGGRPSGEYGNALPDLPGSEWFVGDMSEVVWYATTSLNKESIPRNYYAFMGWTPVEATAMEAFAFTPAGHRGKGNQKRALALTWGLGDEIDFYGRGGSGGNRKPSTDPLIGFSTGVTDYEGYKVFGYNIFGSGVAYRDPATDELSVIDLTRDVNLDDYDVIMFQDWPDEGTEIEWVDQNYPGARERLVKQLRDANDKGVGLYVTHPALAVELGIVDRVEWVPTLEERRYSSGQGNAYGLYDYGSAYKFPWNIAGASGLNSALRVGGTGTGEAANRDPVYLAAKAYYYGDTNKNDRFRVRALIEGLTDIPSYMIQDAVFQVDYDQWGWQGAAYKYLHRMNGLQIGDEYIYHGSDLGMSGTWSDLFTYMGSRQNGTWATPIANVKAGTVVTTFGAKHWNGTQEVDNPYRDYATTIVLQPGDSLGGRAVGGKIYVNYTEQPNRQPDAVFVQKLPEGQFGWPQGYNPDTAEQREWEFSFTRVTLSSTEGNATQSVSYVDPLGNTVTVNVANTSGNLAMVRSRQLFDIEAYPHYQMNSRGLFWLMERPEVDPNGVTVRAEAMTANGVMPEPSVIAERDADVNAGPMRALAAMPKVAEDTSGDVQIITLPMTASASWTGYGKTISAEPMTATAEFVENFDAVHATGEQVVLYVRGIDIDLFIKEEA